MGGTKMNNNISNLSTVNVVPPVVKVEVGIERPRSQGKTFQELLNEQRTLKTSEKKENIEEGANTPSFDVQYGLISQLLGSSLKKKTDE